MIFRRSATICWRQAVAGDLQQLEVEGLVGSEERVALPKLALEAVVQRLQLGELAVGRLAGNLGGGVALQQREQVIHLRHVVARRLGHVGAAARLHRHHALDRQHLQRLAQGRAADSHLGRDLQLVDPGAGLELPREDALAQLLGDLFV